MDTQDKKLTKLDKLSEPIDIGKAMPIVYGILSILILFAVSLITIDDTGTLSISLVKLTQPLWYILTTLKIIGGLMFTAAMKSVGKERGMEKIQDIVDKYKLALLDGVKEDVKPMSWEEWNRKSNSKGLAIKVIISTIMGVTGMAEGFTAGFNLGGLIMAFVSLGTWNMGRIWCQKYG